MADDTMHDGHLDHAEEVTFAVEQYPVTVEDVWTMEVGRDADDRLWAQGQCPICHGRAFGPSLTKSFGFRNGGTIVVDDWVVTPAGTPPATAGTVVVTCRCGHPHGRKAEEAGRDGGCGRYYTVSIHEVDGELRPLPGPPLEARDAAAASLMDEFRVERLQRLQQRAEKWIAGLTALLGLFGTALVVKGPDSFATLSAEPRWAVILLLAAGSLSVAAGLWKSYRAAHGDPLDDDAVSRLVDDRQQSANPIGAADRWEQATSEAYATRRSDLGTAAGLTMFGMLLLAGAILVTWIATPGGSSSSTCLRTSEGIVEVGELPEVVEGEFAVTYVPCPGDDG